MPVDFRSAIRTTQKFALSPSEQRRMGHEMEAPCSEISKKIQVVGQDLKILTSKDRTLLDPESRMEKQLKLATHLEATVQGLASAVDQMVLQSQRLQTSDPIGQIVKFEQKLEKTSNELCDAIKTLASQMDKGTNQKLQEIVKNLSNISEKCKTSQTKLTEIKISIDNQSLVSKKVSGLTKHNINLSLSKTIPKIEQKLTEVNSIVEANEMLSHITVLKIKISSFNISGENKNLNTELNKLKDCKNELTNKKELFKIRNDLKELEITIQSLHPQDLNRQLDLREKLTEIKDRLESFQNLSINNGQLKKLIHSEVDQLLLRSDALYSSQLEGEELKPEIFSNMIEKIQKDLRQEIAEYRNERRTGRWNPEREHLALSSAQKGVEFLTEAARKHFSNDNQVQEKLDSLGQTVSEMQEIHQLSIQARRDEIKAIKHTIEQVDSKIKTLFVRAKNHPPSRTRRGSNHDNAALARAQSKYNRPPAYGLEGRHGRSTNNPC